MMNSHVCTSTASMCVIIVLGMISHFRNRILIEIEINTKMNTLLKSDDGSLIGDNILVLNGK